MAFLSNAFYCSPYITDVSPLPASGGSGPQPGERSLLYNFTCVGQTGKLMFDELVFSSLP